ncbi:MAG TPA: hypothetical protein VGG75_23110 [Trebonia sp.]|jgi:hypothetical protein
MRYEPKHAKSAAPKHMGSKNRYAGAATRVPEMRRSLEGTSGIRHEEATGASPETGRVRNLLGLIPMQHIPSPLS